eukprot:CAMPEP_0169456898 /NCGR_PEP_ID=MMETSP1042-20121227/16594_1 /TAXON_ID=464988 /ORGANISM="Hemiselmis andersenii, Strain CCMP1180" /LENGTH=343 /DNA_ID=CAMNT_0009569143 /DNA_START=39 /DNA_END=1067 /DNA_ORIENTATION=-
MDFHDGLDPPSQHQLDEDLTLLCAFPSTSPVQPSLSYSNHDTLCHPHSCVPMWEATTASSPAASPSNHPPYPPTLLSNAPLNHAYDCQQPPPLSADTYFPGHEVERFPAQVRGPPHAHASPPPLGEIEIPYTPTCATSGGSGGRRQDKKRAKPSTPLLQHKDAPLGEAAPTGWVLAKSDGLKKRRTQKKARKIPLSQSYVLGKKGGKKGAKGTAKSLSAVSFAHLKSDPDGDNALSPRSPNPAASPSKSKKVPSVPKSAGDIPQRCSYELCTNPTHTSGGSWKLVSADTRAGGQDWTMYIGRLFCNACFTQHATKGSMLRLGKQPPPGAHTAAPPAAAATQPP